uniref:Stress-associated endoplasmic reticulum protein n=1 Tax=Sphenodon punctatus TaxID=8508 RepID=A0A8D0H2T5_SPHPU
MVAKQRIRMANEKHSKNITQRGNVAKTSLSSRLFRVSEWVCEGADLKQDLVSFSCEL